MTLLHQILRKMKSVFGLLILLYMSIRGNKIFIDQEMYELWAPETKDEFCSNTRFAFQ